MPFGQRLAQSARATEAELARHLQALEAQRAPARLVAAMRHAALGGGKRLRPFLVLESAALFGVAEAAALPTAAALECIHCYSLVHDDLPGMDNDDLRRGRPTVHKAYDEWTAILAGDALLTLAFEILGDPGTHPDAGIRSMLVLLLSRASGAAGMAGGQCLDLEFDKLGAPAAPDLAHVERLQGMKTGALIQVACEAGAVLGGATPRDREALRRYGADLGAAFQIADDLLDIEGDAAVVGKATGKDAGKATMVSVLGLAAAKTRLAQLQADAVAALAPFGTPAETLRQAASFVAERTS